MRAIVSSWCLGGYCREKYLLSIQVTLSVPLRRSPARLASPFPFLSLCLSLAGKTFQLFSAQVKVPPSPCLTIAVPTRRARDNHSPARLEYARIVIKIQYNPYTRVRLRKETTITSPAEWQGGGGGGGARRGGGEEADDENPRERRARVTHTLRISRRCVEIAGVIRRANLTASRAITNAVITRTCIYIYGGVTPSRVLLA